jgi:Rha family phage regulatory protein
MENLSIINKNGILVTDSREVAQMIGRKHNNLLRDIEGYGEVLQNSILSSGLNIKVEEFFIKSEYQIEENGRKYPCYLLTKKGCDMVANKMTGEKGVLFTAAYVTKFEEMEKALTQSLTQEDLIIMQAQSMKALKEKVAKIESQTEVLNHRITNLDCINIEGTPQQRLNAMVKKYGFMKGVNIGAAWDEFIRKYNNAFHSNLNLRKQSYIKKNKIKYISTPDFLNRMGLIEDALRIADKMLNGKVA